MEDQQKVLNEMQGLTEVEWLTLGTRGPGRPAPLLSCMRVVTLSEMSGIAANQEGLMFDFYQQHTVSTRAVQI